MPRPHANGQNLNNSNRQFRGNLNSSQSISRPHPSVQNINQHSRRSQRHDVVPYNGACDYQNQQILVYDDDPSFGLQISNNVSKTFELSNNYLNQTLSNIENINSSNEQYIANTEMFYEAYNDFNDQVKEEVNNGNKIFDITLGDTRKRMAMGLEQLNKEYQTGNKEFKFKEHLQESKDGNKQFLDLILENRATINKSTAGIVKDKTQMLDDRLQGLESTFNKLQVTRDKIYGSFDKMDEAYTLSVQKISDSNTEVAENLINISKSKFDNDFHIAQKRIQLYKQKGDAQLYDSQQRNESRRQKADADSYLVRTQSDATEYSQRQQYLTQREKEEYDLEAMVNQNREEERHQREEADLMKLQQQKALEMELFEEQERIRIAEIQEEKQLNKQYTTYDGQDECTLHDCRTGVSFTADVYGSGEIDANFRLIYYSEKKTSFRIELEFLKSNSMRICSWISPNIELTNKEDITTNFSFKISKFKVKRINSIKMKFRWADYR